MPSSFSLCTMNLVLSSEAEFFSSSIFAFLLAASSFWLVAAAAQPHHRGILSERDITDINLNASCIILR